MKEDTQGFKNQIKVDGILKILIYRKNSIQTKFAIEVQKYILDVFKIWDGKLR